MSTRIISVVITTRMAAEAIPIRFCTTIATLLLHPHPSSSCDYDTESLSDAFHCFNVEKCKQSFLPLTQIEPFRLIIKGLKSIY